MKKEEYIEILKKGASEWNSWRLNRLSSVEKYGLYLDLKSISLENVDLSGYILAFCDFSESILIGINFNNANLSNSIFIDANLSGSSFVNSELNHSRFKNCRLNGTTFTNTDLRGADFENAFFIESKIENIIVNERFSPDDFKTYEEFQNEVALHKQAYRGTVIENELVICTTKFFNAKFGGSEISNSTMIGAQCAGANFADCIVNNSDFGNANLEKSSFHSSKFKNVNFSHSKLCYSDLTNAELNTCNLSNCDLSSANIIETNFENSILNGSYVYGASVWNLKGSIKEQSDLVITPIDDPTIVVENLKIAQFIFLLLENQEIRDVIDTITSKAVLILGRFTKIRKEVLDTLKTSLRNKGYLPILFDFEPSNKRSLTETIQLLANISKFIIADLTEAKSIPQELSHIIPSLPSVPLIPIIQEKDRGYAMFEHWTRFNSVLPIKKYKDENDLVNNFELYFEDPVDLWINENMKVSILQKRVNELEQELNKLKTTTK